MSKFVYAYVGGAMAATPEEQQAQMQKWESWLGGLGSAVTDRGNPFAASATVKDGGSADGGASRLGGYSIIEAGSLTDATTKAQGCPVLESGGTVEVYEALEM
jgi:hypothetical protein